MTLIFGSLRLGSVNDMHHSAGAQKVDENINGPWDAGQCERNGLCGKLRGTISTSSSKSRWLYTKPVFKQKLLQHYMKVL